MKMLNDEVAAQWQKGLEVNSDPYGHRIYTYAEDWADLMEKAMVNEPHAPEDLALFMGIYAQPTSREADTDGITGYMYGAAVSLLAHAWKYGDALRRWSNLELQIGDEGEKANESGGTLNPALLSIGKK